MLGHPKFHEDQFVEFKIGECLIWGKIYIIDEYGTFLQNEEVSYDIMVKGSHNNILYKHICESHIRAVN